MLYNPLFEFSIFHNYYQNKICHDLSIEPTSECSKILSGHRLIMKNKVNGIVVIAPVNSDKKPWIELANNLKFTFILKLKNKDFLEFTDLTNIDIQPIENINYFSYKNINEIRLSELHFPVAQDCLGIVDIYNSASLPKILDHGSEYKITFQPKKQQWCYYLVTDQSTNEDEFFIEDRETTATTKITFTKVASTDPDPIFSVLKQQFPQSKQYLFKSDAEITCQALGRTNIQLLKRESGEISNSTVWIKNLPNPPNHNGIQIINVLKRF